MKILIDATAITKKPTGVGNYSLKILENLIKIDKKNNYQIIVSEKLKENHPVFNINANFIRESIPAVGPKRQLRYFFFFRKIKLKPDIFYCLTAFLPLNYKGKSVITVHDLTYLRYPQFLSKLKVFYLRKIMKRACQKSDKIIAVSKSTKEDIIKFFGINSSKIEVIYEDKFIENNKEKYKKPIKDSYILYVAEKRPHKNIEGALKILKNLKDKNIKLVLIGKEYKNYEEYKKVICDLGLENRVLDLKNISNEELSNFYANACFFVFPSFYEGFGIPVLEAINFNCPVILSEIKVFRELFGNYCPMFNPRKPKEICEKADKIIENGEYRISLIKKQQELLKFFSWEKSAKKIKNLWQKL